MTLQTENDYYEIRRQAEVLYESDIASGMQYVSIQQQNHLRICGGMALAFATSVFLGTDPQTLNYDMLRLRQHIQACLTTPCVQCKCPNMLYIIVFS